MKSILVNTSIDSYDVDTVMNYLATIGVEKNNVEEAMETIGHLLLGTNIKELIEDTTLSAKVHHRYKMKTIGDTIETVFWNPQEYPVPQIGDTIIYSDISGVPYEGTITEDKGQVVLYFPVSGCYNFGQPQQEKDSLIITAQTIDGDETATFFLRGVTDIDEEPGDTLQINKKQAYVMKNKQLATKAMCDYMYYEQNAMELHIA